MELSLALAGAGVVQAVVYLVFIRAVDLYERESFLVVIPVFVWGFTVAVVISFLFNSLFAFTVSTVAGAPIASFLTTVAGAPVIEECAKGLALLLVFVVSYAVARWRGTIEFSGVMDGIVYGAAVGFGFAIAEDLFYFAQFGPETFLVRRLFGGFAHAAFTSLTGIGIGLIPWVRSGFLKVALPALGLISAILLHAFFNLLATAGGALLAYAFLLVVLLFYVVVIVVWLAAERRVIRNELDEEVDAGMLSSEECAILPSYFRRSGHYLKLLLSGRLAEWRRAKRRHQTAVDLAMTKRLARRSDTALGEPQIEKLRSRLQTLRQAPSPNARP